VLVLGAEQRLVEAVLDPNRIGAGRHVERKHHVVALNAAAKLPRDHLLRLGKRGTAADRQARRLAERLARLRQRRP
jgi:hypothetical protein